MNDDFRDPERPGNDPTGYSRDGAEKASLSCKHCHGGGWAIGFDPDYDGSPIITTLWDDGTEKRTLATVPCYCVCLMGRWMMINHQQTAKDVYQRTPDFEPILRGHSYYLPSDPRARDADTERTIEMFKRRARGSVARGVRSDDILPRYDLPPYGAER